MSDVELIVRLNADVTEVRHEEGRFTFEVVNWRPISFTPPHPDFADAVMALQGEGASRERLLAIAGRSGDPRAVEAVDFYLERFAKGRLLEWELRIGSAPGMVLSALTGGYAPVRDGGPGGRLVLSRFAYLRRDGDQSVLESTEAGARILLRPEAAAWLGRFAVAGAEPGDTVADFLWRAGFCDVEGSEEPTGRRLWEFHDRLFHSYSRSNWDGVPLGGNYPYEGKIPSPPAIVPWKGGEAVPLPVCDLGVVAQRSRSFQALLDERTSKRDYAERPVALPELAEFLYRVARIREVMAYPKQELMRRPFPSGGSIQELEFFAAVGRCEGLPRGIYRYRGLEHQLEPFETTDKYVDRLCAQSAIAMAQPGKTPDVVIVLTSRLPRFAWKYQKMAYRASLMNVGVVFQTMYLVATDMGLAPCGNGSGNSRLFAEATGLDWFEETAMGEFALGRPAA